VSSNGVRTADHSPEQMYDGEEAESDKAKAHLLVGFVTKTDVC